MAENICPRCGKVLGFGDLTASVDSDWVYEASWVEGTCVVDTTSGLPDGSEVVELQHDCGFVLWSKEREVEASPIPAGPIEEEWT